MNSIVTIPNVSNREYNRIYAPMNIREYDQVRLGAKCGSDEDCCVYRGKNAY